MAALLVGGLLVLDPYHLRDLIFADSSPGTALGLLLFGFVVTFGSAAMGTAIMAIGQVAEAEMTGRAAVRLRLVAQAVEPRPIAAGKPRDGNANAPAPRFKSPKKTAGFRPPLLFDGLPGQARQ